MPGENEDLCLVENIVSHSDGTRLAQSRESSHWKKGGDPERGNQTGNLQNVFKRAPVTRSEHFKPPTCSASFLVEAG